MKQESMSKISTWVYSPFFLRDICFCWFKLGYWRSSWRFLKLPIFHEHKGASIVIGEKFKASNDPHVNSIGVFQKVIIKALSSDAKRTIGYNVGVSGATISGKNITIGNHVLIGSGVLITDSDAHPLNPKEREKPECIMSAPITICNDVFIGARSIILKGVTIGEGSVIGAGSVVVKNIPAHQIWAGNPAKFVKNVT